MAAISTGLERLGYGGSDGCIAVGQHKQVINDAVATRTLLSKESGALCLFDRAAGVTYTLPAPVAGMVFDFGVTVTGTGTYKIVTNATSTVFMVGGVQVGSETAGGHDSFAANGTNIAAITMDADTKGRILGGAGVRCLAISATQWYVSGWLVGSGTVATPFTAS